MTGPNKEDIYPLKTMNGFVFFKEYHKNPNIVVGDYYVLRF
jgi:hypothetical protein